MDPVSDFNIKQPRGRDKRLRIATVRYLPRGVRKQDWPFDVWLPEVAPSAKLLREFQDGAITAAQLFRRYRAEMKRPEARHTIALLGAVAERTPISVGCHCADREKCHRSVLSELIRAAMA